MDVDQSKDFFLPVLREFSFCLTKVSSCTEGKKLFDDWYAHRIGFMHSLVIGV